MDTKRRTVLACLAGLLLLAPWGIGPAWADKQDASPRQAAVERCRADLASRLKVALARITLVSAVAETFPDTSLGLPQPGEMAAQVITPGWRVILDSPRGRHMYCVAGGAPRYGGAVEKSHPHALYLRTVANEPNLNRDLVQVDLDGSHEQVVIPSVSRFSPQSNGAVLAVRRTSRSGHALLYLAPGTETDSVVLARAFDFGATVLGPDGSQWAALARPRLGLTWTVMMGDTRNPAVVRTAPDLPANVTPKALYWSGENLAVEGREAGTCYELAADTWRPLAAFHAPPPPSRLINKSERLEARSETQDGHPVVRVLRVWFTGDEKPVATLRDCTLEDCHLAPNARLALVCVRSEDTHRAFTVDLVTGAVKTSVPRATATVQMRAAASR